MRVSLFLRRLHKWIGLVIGLQVLLWITGGVVMSFFPIDQVRGEHRVRGHMALPLESRGVNFSVAELLRQWEPATVKQVTLKRWQDRMVYEVTTPDQTFLVDTGDGKNLTPLAKEAVEQVAVNDYNGTAPIREVTPLTVLPAEIRGRELPLWKVVFEDDIETTLYISPQSGEVVARRNTLWRVYDFFWMLHIMDYDQRTNFNNGLLITAACIAWLIALSGLWLLFYAFTRRDWRWLLPKK